MGKAQKQFKISPLTGGVNSTAETGSLISVANKDGLGIEFVEQTNWIPLRRGGLSKTKGFTQVVDLTGSITGLHEFVRSNGVTQRLATRGTNLYTWTDTTSSSVATGLSSNALVDFTTALDLCVLCDGVSAPFKWDSATLSALGGSPPTGARQSLFYQNRLWVFSATNEPSLLYYSDPNNAEAGYGSNFINCSKNDGEKITAIASYFIPATVEPVLIVAKERSVGIVTGNGSVSSPYTFSKINTEAGVPGFRQIVQYGQDIAYLTSKGVSTYKTDAVDPNLVYKYLSEKIRNEFTSVNAAMLPKAIAFYDGKNSRMGFAVPETGETVNNAIWFLDTQLGCWYKEEYNLGQDVNAVLVLGNGTVYHGSSTGKIYKWDESNSFNGQSIASSLRTDFIDFGDSLREKRILELRIKARGQSDYGVTVAVNINDGNVIGRAFTMQLQGARYRWGSSVWSNNPNISQWNAARVQNKPFYPEGWFRSIQFVFTHDWAGQPVDIYDIEALVEYGDWR